MSLASLLLAFAPALAARFEKPEKPEKPPSYICARCGAESFNANDIRERYCGRCHAFAELEAARAELERVRRHERHLQYQQGLGQAAQNQQLAAYEQGVLEWPNCTPARSDALTGFAALA